MYLLARSFAVGLLLAAFALGQSSELQRPAAPPRDAPTPPSGPKRIRVSPGVADKLLLKKVAPRASSSQSKHVEGPARIQGTVVLHIIIGTTGDVQSAELVTGHPMLVPAAIKAVKQWKYKPYVLNGEPVEVDTRVDMHFDLE